MDNKELLNKVEDEYYNELLKITNVRDFNKEIGEKELKAIKDNKSSFKVMLGYLLNTRINEENNNSSYITFGLNFTFSYLLNFLKMTPYNFNSLEEHTYNIGLLDGDRIPYYFDNEEPTIKRIDSDVIYSLDYMMLNIDVKYFSDNRDLVISIIKEYADIYNIVAEKKDYTNNIDNEFILVPKGYKVDDPSKFTRKYACNHLKDGEIYFKIYPYKFKYSFLNLLKNKYGDLDLSECLNHYKYSYKYDHISEKMLYPITRKNLKDTSHTLKSLFNECLIDHALRECQWRNDEFSPKYFIFRDDIYQKFIEMGYSSSKSYEKCEIIYDYSWSNKETDDNQELKELHKLIGDVKFKDITNKFKYRYYDEEAVEFYYLVKIALYKYKYRDEFEKLRDEYLEIYRKCLSIVGA